MDPTSNDSVSMRGRKGEDADTEEWPREDRGRDGITQPPARRRQGHEQLEDAGRILPKSLQEYSPADTLISDFTFQNNEGTYFFGPQLPSV